MEGQHNFFAGEVLVHNCLLIDDPHKNRAEAESSTLRGKIKEWWTSTALTRVHPKASIVVVHTRWHPDDLIGSLRDGDHEHEWTVIELRAIADGTDPLDSRAVGEPLWPDFMPADFLAKRRRDVGEYDWASLYDQRPRPKGGAVFSGDVRFAAPPTSGYRVAIGLDLAYTERTASDYSVAVVMAECNGIYHILDVHRMQAPVPAFGARLRGLLKAYPGAKMFAYVGGQERGVVDLLNEPPLDGQQRLSIETRPAVADKFIRAQPVAAAWNAGRVSLPVDAPAWANPFVSELRSFTGIKDPHDDQVDALAAAHDALATGVVQTPPPLALFHPDDASLGF